MKFKIILMLLLVASQTYAQDLYLKTYGEPTATSMTAEEKGVPIN